MEIEEFAITNNQLIDGSILDDLINIHFKVYGQINANGNEIKITFFPEHVIQYIPAEYRTLLAEIHNVFTRFLNDKLNIGSFFSNDTYYSKDLFKQTLREVVNVFDRYEKTHNVKLIYIFKGALGFPYYIQYVPAKLFNLIRPIFIHEANKFNGVLNNCP